jgi:HK97 family phage prohead protease
MRAYSLFEVKSLSEERRILSGMASTPTPDRVRDIVEPLGMKLRGAVNLFLYHQHSMPVGHVEFGRPSKKGIPFEASIPDVVEDGIVKERVNEAWHSVKYRLLQAVSIGFKQLNDAYEILGNGGVRYKEWEMLELSLVGIPANPDALVSAFKSFDPAQIREQMGLEAQADPERRALVEKALRGAVPLIGLPKTKPENLNGAVRLTRS